MSWFKIPHDVSLNVEAHGRWLHLLSEAQVLIEEDADLQAKVAKGLRLKDRRLPPEVLGRMYAQYCNLINRMYDSYLKNMQLQKAPYIQEIIAIFFKRMYELRKELVHVVVNDYIYVDVALTQQRLTPFDIEIVVPYHIPLEARPDTIEQTLQTMWRNARRRKRPPKEVKPPPSPPIARDVSIALFDVDHVEEEKKEVKKVENEEVEEEEEVIYSESTISSVHTIVPIEFIHANIIQRHERYRQYYVRDFRSKSADRKKYFASKSVEPPIELKDKGAAIIQRVYREYMKIKRRQILSIKRDMILGIVPDTERRPLDYCEETNKFFENRRRKRMLVEKTFREEIEREKARLLMLRKGEQIEDITEQILEWFSEWYYGYGFFPQYPYEAEGGTVLVIRGQYQTIEEQIEEDERIKAATKGKNKEQLKQEKKQAELDAQMKAEALKEKEEKEKLNFFKARCNPLGDPGYEPWVSDTTAEIIEVLRKYRQSWSIYDWFPPTRFPEILYGYMKDLITQDLMHEMHYECRKYVDELMRLELKLFVKAHQAMYKRVGWKYPKFRPRKRPPVPRVLQPFEMDRKMLKKIEELFDLDIITKPTTKLKDIVGDLNYAAYDYLIRDPNVVFLPPAYGDVKRRLILSCVYGSGIEPAAVRNRSVMLLGQERNGKSFLVDAVAGELNAVKIDISPEKFSAVLKRPGKMLNIVFLAARAFQPTVVYMRNVERVFCKKVAPEDRRLKARSVKKALGRLIKSISQNDKIIFIATCSNPFVARTKPMLSWFDEVILVPRPDYGSLQRFFYEKLQSIRSMPRDYCVQPIAQNLQGYGFGIVVETYNNVMTPARIVELNVTPLSAMEFLEPLIEADIEPLSLEDFRKYMDYFIQTSYLKAEREEYAIINAKRGAFFEKIEKKKAEAEAKKAKEQKA